MTTPALRGALFGPVTAEDEAMGAVAETAVFAQWFHSRVALHYARWRSGRTQGEVDIVRLDARQKPRWCLDVKWSDRAGGHSEELKSLAAFADRHPGAKFFVTSRTLTRKAVPWSRAGSLDILPTSFYCYAVGLSAVRLPSVDFDWEIGD